MWAKIENFDMVNEPWQLNPYQNRPVIIITASQRMINFFLERKNFVKIKITGTETYYDETWWASVVPFGENKFMLVLRGEWIGYPPHDQLGQVEILEDRLIPEKYRPFLDNFMVSNKMLRSRHQLT